MRYGEGWIPLAGRPGQYGDAFDTVPKFWAMLHEAGRDPAAVHRDFRRITVRGVVVGGCVVKERLETSGCVPEAGCVAKERFMTVGCIAEATRVVKERVKTHGRVVSASCETGQSPSAFTCIAVADVAIRCG